MAEHTKVFGTLAAVPNTDFTPSLKKPVLDAVVCAAYSDEGCYIQIAICKELQLVNILQRHTIGLHKVRSR